MNTTRWIATAGAILLLFPAFAASMSQGGGEKENLPPAEGKALHKYITETNDYESWQLWPGKGKLYQGTEPHGALLTTYLNEAAMKGLSESPANLPDGSIIVKENYTPDKNLAAVTVMYKKADYNPAAGDFFWLKYGADGGIQKEGKVDGCINCHRTAKGNDFLFTNDKK